MRRAAAAAVLAGFLAGCTVGKPPPTGPARLGLTPVSFRDLPGWREDDVAQAVPPFLAACARMPQASSLGGSERAAALGDSPAQWRSACAAAAGVPPGDTASARAMFEAQFAAYALSDASNGNASGLFTGYYEPQVAGSRVGTGAYRTPLLGRPRDLMQVDLGRFAPDLKGRSVTGRIEDGTLVPYFDRQEIEAGALSRRRLELLWLADPVDAFVLQIQGSGRVRLPDGHVVRVTYDGQNGRPYVPIGRVLADRGEIPLARVSMQSIRAWLADHPDQAATVMDANPSYVFFREADDLRPNEGPPGALGAALTPGRSAAVDRHFIPLGAPLFVVTTDPLGGGALRRLLIAADTGGAIRGPVRADVFWGWDANAETRAGLMHAPGTGYVLLPKRPGP